MMTVCPNSLTNARLGLAVAKKHYKKATDRNLIKRIIRENFRQNLLKPVDVVFVTLSKTNTKNRQNIHQAITGLLDKI